MKSLLLNTIQGCNTNFCSADAKQKSFGTKNSTPNWPKEFSQIKTYNLSEGISKPELQTSINYPKNNLVLVILNKQENVRFDTYNFQYVFTGDMFREYAKQFGYDNILTFQTEDLRVKQIDKLVDDKIYEIGKNTEIYLNEGSKIS